MAAASLAFSMAATKRTVDLEAVEGQGSQMGEGGIARPEIIEADVDAGPVQLLEIGLHVLGAGAEEHALGHLDADMAARDALDGEDREQAVGESAVSEVGIGDIDRDAVEGQPSSEHGGDV